jgi:adenylate cyclase
MAEERVQRRLAAILVADVVGYSRLIGDDEAGTRSRINQSFDELILPSIDDHNGRLVKTMGDGFLVEFGSVVEAVQCATDIQNGLTIRENAKPQNEKLLLRIGIHLGDVIVEADDIHGDGVNIAARLEEIAEPGEICVSDMVYAGVRNKISLDFDALGERSLKNIGEPVQVYQTLLTASNSQNANKLNALFRRPAVAVLPFGNMSDDPEQDYFADGLTEDIITALSQWKSFPVIARNSTFAFKGQSPDIRKVGSDLGARYVVEGSVRKMGSRVRVSVQLINSETGHHVWAERLDREVEDIFLLQDELTARIAATVAPELERAEQRNLKSAQPANLNSWECYQRGMSSLFELTSEGNRRAQELCSRAVELDPEYVSAYVGLAFSYYRDMLMGEAETPTHTKEKMFEAARKAVALDEADSSTHWVLGLACHVTGEYDRAIASASRAVELNSNRALNFIGRGVAYLLAGRYGEAIPDLETGILLNPLDPRNALYMTILALAKMGLGNYEEALGTGREAIARNPEIVDSHIVVASCLGHLGRRTEALEERKECERLLPGSTASGVGVMRVVGLGPEQDGHYQSTHRHEIVVEGLHKACGEG